MEPYFLGIGMMEISVLIPVVIIILIAVVAFRHFNKKK